MAATTLADVKAFSGITGTDLDAQITALIPAAEAMVERLVGLKMEKRVGIDERHDGRGQPRVVLDCRPVIQVSQLFDDVNRAFTGTPIQSSEYTVDLKAGVVALDGIDPDWPATQLVAAFQRGNKNVKVVYDAGYEAADVPDDLKLLVSAFVMIAINTGKKAGLSSETIGRYSYTLADVSALSPTVTSILNSYGVLSTANGGMGAATGTILG